MQDSKQDTSKRQLVIGILGDAICSIYAKHLLVKKEKNTRELLEEERSLQK